MEKRGKEEEVFANNLGERMDKRNEIFWDKYQINILLCAITKLPLPQMY
jgi:hypothetical protein